MSGYSLKQLLELTQDDGLIDSFQMKDDDHVEIVVDGKRNVFRSPEAVVLLLDLIRRINRLEGDA